MLPKANKLLENSVSMDIQQSNFSHLDPKMIHQQSTMTDPDPKVVWLTGSDKGQHHQVISNTFK